MRVLGWNSRCSMPSDTVSAPCASFASRRRSTRRRSGGSGPLVRCALTSPASDARSVCSDVCSRFLCIAHCGCGCSFSNCARSRSWYSVPDTFVSPALVRSLRRRFVPRRLPSGARASRPASGMEMRSSSGSTHAPREERGCSTAGSASALAPASSAVSTANRSLSATCSSDSSRSGGAAPKRRSLRRASSACSAPAPRTMAGESQKFPT